VSGPEEIWRRYDAMEARLTAPVSERMLDLARVGPGMRVLDLATGRGEPAIRAAHRVGSKGCVLGVDPAAGVLSMAQERATLEGVTNLELRALDAAALAGVDASFDVALTRWGLMYMAAPVTALAAARRALVPGGVLVAAVWVEPERVPYFSVPRRVLEKWRAVPPPDRAAPGVFYYAELEPLRRDLSAAGLHLEHSEELETTVMEVATPAELVAWVRAFGLERLLSDMSERDQRAYEDDLVAAVERRDGRFRLGGVTRLIVAR
jgi:ubiquinone/menaquinone biosynthesis C-methylase UbiE